MKKLKKIKIKINGKYKLIPNNYKIHNLIKKMKIPINKVIIDKNKINKMKLKNNDKIEIVHFIGGG